MAIGVCDSGIGGLTVFKALANDFEHQNLIYFGDVARVPYGNKSPETIIKYSYECASYLVEKYAIKALVLACNTTSSYAISFLQDKLQIPVLGVIKPGSMHAVSVTKNKKIGVLGTHATVNSKSYINEIKQLMPEANIYQQPCPLFVPLVEEGILSGKVAEVVVEDTLKEISKTGIDTAILACTHYPLLNELISKNLPNVQIVDSTKFIIDDISKLNLKDEEGIREVLATDDTPAFYAFKNLIIGNSPIQVIEL